jgi:hypothetical protein
MAILDGNGIPILDLSNSSREFVEGKHQAYLNSGDEKHLLTGAQVYIQNPHPAGASEPGVTSVRVGGETLDESLKSIIGAVDTLHTEPVGNPSIRQAPEWVASSDDDLARLLAEHYGCQVKAMEELQ